MREVHSRGLGAYNGTSLPMNMTECLSQTFPSRPSPPRIVVVGSVNMDLVARMHHLPRPGETVSGESFQTIPGGKGANQAVAAARLGARVAMIARVGDDSFGTLLRQNLIADGIETDAVLVTTNCSSGVALIGVDFSGANAITVVPGANGQLTTGDIELYQTLIAKADALVVQLETPWETVAAAIEIAQREGVLTLIDPAPAPLRGLSPRLMSADLISPNQTEAEALTGIAVTDWESARQGARDIVLKMGELGALAMSRTGSIDHVVASRIDVVDTTAAGDAFTAALAVALCEGHSLQEATRWGVSAGSLACTRFGAQPAMPSRAELDRSVGSDSDR